MKSLFEKSQKDQHAYSLPRDSEEWSQFLPAKNVLRKSLLPLPEISELDLMRHFIGLSRRNVGIDSTFYPLGSCTMKYNPRINETCAALPGFSQSHPLSPDSSIQGNLRIIFELLKILIDLTGMEGGTLLPNAGAQGELTGIKLIAAYHQAYHNNDRMEFLIPDSAHGTNPATATMAGFQTRTIKTDLTGDLDLEELRKACSAKTAGLMLTNPNTLGLFSPKILEIAKTVHQAGGLLYYDGANMNPILTIAKPGEMGFDVMHLNLHKTFSTPHGGGGPGSGPVLCKRELIPFLPLPIVKKTDQGFASQWSDGESIGSIATFYGNFAIYLRAFVYIQLHGKYGMHRIAENAVLNANYLKKKLSRFLKIPFDQHCMHEFIAQILHPNIRAYDIAKRMLDYGVHPPSVYFPLIIKECFLIEPTESESKQTLDQFVNIVEKIMEEVKNNPEICKTAPHTTVVGRLDETKAAREPILVDPIVSGKNDDTT